MSWEEFKQMLIGIAPDTALGRIVSVRAEDRKEYLENFTPEQQRKAMEALAKKKETDEKKDIAMLWRVLALLKIQDTLLPYRILYDLEKAER